MSRKALVLLVCCCDFRDGAERLIPSKSLGNAVIRAFPGLFRILRMCAPRHAAAVVRPRERKKSADRRRRILISRLLIIRASVPRRKSPFPAYFKGFPAVSLLIPPYPAFLKYPVSPHREQKEKPRLCRGFSTTKTHRKDEGQYRGDIRRRSQLPRYHFACRKTGRSTAARMDRRAYPVNGGGPATITRRSRLSPRLLTGDGLPVPCCRFAPPTAL